MPEVSDLEVHLGFWLRFVSNHVSGRFGRLLAEQHQTQVSEWVALRTLYASGTHTAGQLAEVLGMTKGAVTKLVDRLLHRGLVTRTPDPGDSRIQHIALTRAGAALVPKLAAVADANDAHFFSHLPPGQRKALAGILREIVRRHDLRRIPTE